MYDLKVLSGMLSLTEKQVRQRLTILRPLVAGHVSVGRYGRLLADDHVLTLLRRLGELETTGATLQASVEQMESELNNSNGNGHKQVSTVTQPDGDLLAEMRARLSYIEEENRWLRAKLDEALSKVPALPKPAASQQQMNRWQALRIVLLGR